MNSQNRNDYKILDWLEKQDYLNIETEKYNELLHDYKNNYSIYKQFIYYVLRFKLNDFIYILYNII